MRPKIISRIMLFIWPCIFSTICFGATFPVFNGNNQGAGSLRQAILDAQNGDVIAFQGPIVVQLTTGALYLDKSVTITGVSGARITRAPGAPAFRLLFIDNTTPRSGRVSIHQLIFSDGISGGGSAILNLYPSLEITGCTFENNSGSAVRSEGIAQFQELRNCIFRNNLSGAFEVIGGPTTMIQCDFVGNGISGTGGAIAASGGAIILHRCTIRGNRSVTGGGIAVGGTTASIVNCTITGNRATTAGGGIYIGAGGTINLHSSTISGNAAPAGGAARLLATAAINATNTIFWGNNTEIAMEAGSAANIQHSIVQGGFAGTGNLNKNPAFVTPVSTADPNPVQGGNFQLTSCSPAINAGTSSNAPNTDLNGSARPQLGGFDIGAFESNNAASTGIVYVWPGAGGNNSGSSWLNAFTTLQAALAFATQCPLVQQVWVAKGTYYPDEGPSMINDDRSMRFSMRSGLAIYGGFAGTETLLVQRNLKTAPSILSGEIQQDNNAANNTNSLFTNQGVDSTALLDGFILTGGASAGTGGAIINNNSSPIFRNCIFRSNMAVSWAGAVHNTAGSNPVFTNCVFTGNTAPVGGVMFNSSSSPMITNCTFASNSSPSGSAIWSQTNSFARITNCIVWANTGSAALINTITSPYTISYSLTQETMPGAGNLAVNPLFANDNQGDFRLTGCSPAINTGTGADAPASDILGFARPALGGVDMGAFERQTAGTTIIYVDATATGNNEGSSWSNAYTSLGAAINELNNCNLPVNMLIATGTYVVASNEVFTFNKLNIQVLAGYPKGGGPRSPGEFPVIIKGELRVLKSLRMDGVRLQ